MVSSPPPSELFLRSLIFDSHLLVLVCLVVGAVLKFSSLDRIQQRFVEEIATNIWFLAVEVFKVLARDRLQVLHPRTCPVLRMKLLQGVSALFHIFF